MIVILCRTGSTAAQAGPTALRAVSIAAIRPGYIARKVGGRPGTRDLHSSSARVSHENPLVRRDTTQAARARKRKGEDLSNPLRVSPDVKQTLPRLCRAEADRPKSPV